MTLQEYPYDNKFEGYASSPASTLSVDELGYNESGQLIQGEIAEDYYTWVNDFNAHHEDFGFLFGNFEDNVFYAESQEALTHFLASHKPQHWDYWDI